MQFNAFAVDSCRVVIKEKNGVDPKDIWDLVQTRAGTKIDLDERAGVTLVERPDLNAKSIDDRLIVDFRGEGTRLFYEPVKLKEKIKFAIKKHFHVRTSDFWMRTSLPSFKENLWQRTQATMREHALIYLTNSKKEIVFMSSVMVGTDAQVNLNQGTRELRMFLQTYPYFGLPHTVHSLHTHPYHPEAHTGMSAGDLKVSNLMRKYEIDQFHQFKHFMFEVSIIDGNIPGYNRAEIGFYYFPPLEVIQAK